jgi:hypothetical protein
MPVQGWLLSGPVQLAVLPWEWVRVLVLVLVLVRVLVRLRLRLVLRVKRVQRVPHLL